MKNKNYTELETEPVEFSLRSKVGKIISPEDINSVPAQIEGLINEQEYEALRREIMRSFSR